MVETQIEPPAVTLPPERLSRWPAEFALLTAWLLPATTARRTAHVSLRRAFSVHLITVALASVLVIFMVLWDDAANEITPAQVLSRVFETLYHEWKHNPGDFTVAVIGGALGIELGFIALASLVVAWGARIEPLRASYAHALRRTWLQTGHVLLPILVVGILAVHFDHARRDWWLNSQYTSQQEPWYVRYGEAFSFYASLLSGAWISWALLRAVGTMCNTPQITPSPLCEFCGYNLTTASMEGRCPECGEAVIESLGANVRPGWTGGYWRSCLDAIFEPVNLGRQIRLFSPGTEHRWLLAWHLIPIFFISAVGFLLVIIAIDGTSAIQREPEILLIGAPVVGCFTAAAALTLTLFAAAVIGLILSYRFSRNLMPATIQIACYLSGFLVLSVAFSWLTGVLLAPDNRWSHDLQAMWRMPRQLIRLIVWFAVNLIWLAMYTIRLWRGASAAAFANR